MGYWIQAVVLDQAANVRRNDIHTRCELRATRLICRHIPNKCFVSCSHNALMHKWCAIRVSELCHWSNSLRKRKRKRKRGKILQLFSGSSMMFWWGIHTMLDCQFVCMHACIGKQHPSIETKPRTTQQPQAKAFVILSRNYKKTQVSFFLFAWSKDHSPSTALESSKSKLHWEIISRWKQSQRHQPSTQRLMWYSSMGQLVYEHDFPTLWTCEDADCP